jgi:hypothetical protein
MMAIPDRVLRSFHARWFQWVEREWEAEIEARFGRLSSVPSVEADAFVAVLSDLAPERLAVLAKALNKSRPMGPKAVVGDLAGGVSVDERHEVDTFRKAAWERMSASRLTGPGGAWTAARARQSILRKAVREALGSLAGDFEEFGGNDEWRYRASICGWTVYTHLDLSSRQQQLIYSHSIRENDGSALLEGVSLMSWLGIMGSTRWNTLATGREPEAAAVLRDLCAHFLAGLPALLEGHEVPLDAG